MAEKRTHTEIGPVGRLVAENVRRLRSERQFTTADLAQNVSTSGVAMSASTVTKVEKLSRRLTVDELVALADALNVTPAVLLVPADTDPVAEVAMFAAHMLRSPFHLEVDVGTAGTMRWTLSSSRARQVGSRAEVEDALRDVEDA